MADSLKCWTRVIYRGKTKHGHLTECQPGSRVFFTEILDALKSTVKQNSGTGRTHRLHWRKLGLRTCALSLTSDALPSVN